MDASTSDHVRGTKRKYSEDQQQQPRASSDDATTSARRCQSTPPLVRDHAMVRSGADSDASPDVDADAVFATEERYRTLYSGELDFRALGEQDPELGALLLEGDGDADGEGGGGEEGEGPRPPRLDFTDPRAVMQLTKTLLWRDFGLRVDLPPDRLCPPVPNRHNYVLWLKDLLDSSALSPSPSSCAYSDAYDPRRRVRGLDIGTGASLIYPLLACAQRPRWSFLATDIDARSLAFARRNAERNGLLGGRVRVVDRSGAGAGADAPLIPPLDELVGADATLDFVMTNPPFYASEAEQRDLARQKARPPRSACTGAPVEMVYSGDNGGGGGGGEVGFVRRLLDESLALGTRVQWYTAMLGKQSSVGELVAALRDRGVGNYAVAAFVQGRRTRRWALGWSFHSRRPSLGASRWGGVGVGVASGDDGGDARAPTPTLPRSLLPCPTELVAVRERVAVVDVDVDVELELGRWKRLLCGAMEGLDLVSWDWDGDARDKSRGVGFADGNVWSRAYRRKRERGEGGGGGGHQAATVSQQPPLLQPQRRPETLSTDGEMEPGLSTTTSQQEHPRAIADCAFGFAISVQVERGSDSAHSQAEEEEDGGGGGVAAMVVRVRWLQGRDYTVFESFTGMVRNTILRARRTTTSAAAEAHKGKGEGDGDIN
ncbi:hypothetical protein SLS62_008395 [Diatrype stigma]|uniref:U6 small nuclear RNA (adenine-(43)-N(6))-methyltransferase n=1 Tax=Diatrype stigma TaxID=117547 RepID=A0AAN9UVS3_9PEZI